MHIAYLGPEIPALSATFIYREIVALRERGHRVDVFTVRRPRTPATDTGLDDAAVLYGPVGQQVIGSLKSGAVQPVRATQAVLCAAGDVFRGLPESRRALGLMWQAAAGLRLAQYLQHAGVEHLHVHFAHFPAQIAMYASMASGIPFSVMGHANDLYENTLLLKEKAERSVGFPTISQFNVDLLSTMGVPTDKLSVVRCGLPDIPSVLPAYRSVSQRPRIGSLGRLVEKKGMLDLIDAFAMYHQRVPGATLAIVGEGPERTVMEQKIVEHGLNDQITLLGAMPNSQVQQWLSGLDLFVLACRTDKNGDKDGIPVALMEAMMHGIPAVSTDLTGIPELIIDNKTGYLSPAADPDSLAGRIDEALTGETSRMRIREAALDHLQSEFSIDVNLDRLETIFEGASS
ncbi:MAG: glycosyltransferase family 4 protein [Pseudomonadota bacterium]